MNESQAAGQKQKELVKQKDSKAKKKKTEKWDHKENQKEKPQTAIMNKKNWYDEKKTKKKTKVYQKYRNNQYKKIYKE